MHLQHSLEFCNKTKALIVVDFWALWKTVVGRTSGVVSNWLTSQWMRHSVTPHRPYRHSSPSVYIYSPTEKQNRFDSLSAIGSCLYMQKLKDCSVSKHWKDCMQIRSNAWAVYADVAWSLWSSWWWARQAWWLPAQRETGFKVGTIKVQIPQNPRTKNFVEAVKCSQVKKFSLCFQPGRDGWLFHTQPVSTFQKVETGCFFESLH
jgi:hypothetical protein